jgi:hypothetical protein
MEGHDYPKKQRTQKPLHVVPGDVELIDLIYEHRFARIDNLSVLTGRSYKKLHGRLFKLAQHGYLKRIILPLQKHIYAIGPAAVPVLVEQGTASAELAAERLRSHELKELFLKHQMMVVDIHTMLAAPSTEAIKLVAWKEGWRLQDHVDVVERGVRRRLPIYPDAYFTLGERARPAGHNEASFFLEADRSTTTHARFAEKIVAYWSYLTQGLHTKIYGSRAFRVDTITLSAERARKHAEGLELHEAIKWATSNVSMPRFVVLEQMMETDA